MHRIHCPFAHQGTAPMRAITITALGMLASLPVTGSAQQIRLGGQVRPRYEFLKGAGESPTDFVSMRVRADLTATLDRGVSAFVRLQDVRLWGEETLPGADARADDFGLHEGYAQLAIGKSAVWTARAGRQEIGFGEERLVGPSDWAQRNPVFDGARVGLKAGFGTADLFGFKIAETHAPGVTNDVEFAGVYAQIAHLGPGSADVYALFNHTAGIDTRQGTLGTRLAVAAGPTDYRIEGAYQLGDRIGRSVRAFMLAAKGTLSFAGKRASVTAWYDYLSGDAAPDDAVDRGFSTVFGTNHKFYGIADVLNDFPAHTAGRGLQDIALKLSASPIPDLRLLVDGHAFRLAQPGPLPARLGEEVDFVATHPHGANLTIAAGAAWVRAGPGMRALGRLDGNRLFSYAMIDVKF